MCACVCVCARMRARVYEGARSCECVYPCPHDILGQNHVRVKAAPGDGILPTKLYCTNHNVDEENTKRPMPVPSSQILDP